GTGYSGDQARSLRAELDKIGAAKPRLGNTLPTGAEKGVRWAAPQLVCEVEFGAWTADRLIRQSVLLGLREDRPGEDVGLETMPKQSSPGAPSLAPSLTLPRKRGREERDRGREERGRGREGRELGKEGTGKRRKLTHPERILWPEPGITKQGLADFY